MNGIRLENHFEVVNMTLAIIIIFSLYFPFFRLIQAQGIKLTQKLKRMKLTCIAQTALNLFRQHDVTACYVNA